MKAASGICVGDLVRVVTVPPRIEVIPAETIAIFEKCVGQTFRVDGFDDYGHIELNMHDDGSQTSDYCAHTL